MSVTLDKPAILSLRKDHDVKYDLAHFGLSTRAQRDRWQSLMADARRGTPAQQYAAAEARREGHLAFEYTQGFRDAVRALTPDTGREIADQLLGAVWLFYIEYEWHVFRAHRVHGGSRTGWIECWQRYLRNHSRLAFLARY